MVGLVTHVQEPPLGEVHLAERDVPPPQPPRIHRGKALHRLAAPLPDRLQIDDQSLQRVPALGKHDLGRPGRAGGGGGNGENAWRSAGKGGRGCGASRSSLEVSLPVPTSARVRWWRISPTDHSSAAGRQSLCAWLSPSASLSSWARTLSMSFHSVSTGAGHAIRGSPWAT